MKSQNKIEVQNENVKTFIRRLTIKHTRDEKSASSPLINLNTRLPLSNKRNRNSFFKFIPILKEKIYNIRHQAGSGKIDYLNEVQLKFINDNSFNIEYKEHEKKTVGSEEKMLGKRIFDILVLTSMLLRHFLKKKLSRGLSFIKVINPSSKIKSLWDTIFSIFTILNMLLFTLSLSFSLPPSTIYYLTDEVSPRGDLKEYNLFMLCNLMVYVFNVLICLNTAFHESGDIVMSRSKIFLSYLKNSLLVDLTICCYLVYNFNMIIEKNSSEAPSVLGLIFVYKVKDVLITLDKIEENFYQNDFLEPLLSLGKLIVKILFLTHLFACIWFSIADDYSERETWIRKIGIQDKSWRAKYVYSLYWSLTTTATVGYGDITPQNESEVMITMIAMLAGCAMFGYSLNKIGNILENMNKKNLDFKNQLRSVNKYMHFNSFDSDLKVKIRKYLEYTYREEKVNDGKAEELLSDKLNSLLKEEVLLKTFGSVLQTHSLFKDTFSQETIRRLVHKMGLAKFSPEEFVKMGEAGTQSLFFIAKGKIGLRLTKNKERKIKDLQILKKGESFGESFFFSDNPLKFFPVSLNFSTLYYLNKNDFLEVLSANNPDYQKYCEIRDKIILYNDFSGLKSKCKSCGSPKHDFVSCPSIHFIPKTNMVLMKHIYSPFQERHRFSKKMKRRQMMRKNINALMNLNKVKFSCNRLLKEGSVTLMMSLTDMELLSEDMVDMMPVEDEESKQPESEDLLENNDSHIDFTSLKYNEINKNLFNSTRPDQKKHSSITSHRGNTNVYSNKKLGYDLTVSRTEMLDDKNLQLTSMDKLPITSSGEIRVNDDFKKFSIILNADEKKKSTILGSTRRMSKVVPQGEEVANLNINHNEDHPQIENHDLFLKNFDSYRIWAKYFPLHNIDFILTKVNEKYKKKKEGIH